MDYYVVADDNEGRDGWEREASVFVLEDGCAVLDFRTIKEAEDYISKNNIDPAFITIIVGIKANAEKKVRIEM